MSQIHHQPHPAAGQQVTVTVGGNVVQATVEDWFDRLIGASWRFASDNPIAVAYAMRRELSHLPNDDEVIYIKAPDRIAHLVHASELTAVHTATSPQ